MNREWTGSGAARGRDAGEARTASSDPVADLLADCLRAPASERRRRLEDLCDENALLAPKLRERLAALEALGLQDVVTSSGDAARSATREAPIAFGDFELFEVIGEGGMGVVHRARQRSLDREVVVKLMRPELLHFGGSRRRFEREAEAIAKLHHPGIVPIYAVGEQDGVPYFAMELVDGRGLDALLASLEGRAVRELGAADLAPSGGSSARGGSWSRSVLELGRQVAAALHHAHSNGILHRDVKPSNILLDADGRARLIDFGLHTVRGVAADGEAQASRLTREGSAPGTLLYMAPEQLESGTYDVRSEVYALAATLYELLTLEPPFRGADRSSTERLIRSGGALPLRRRVPSLGRDVEAVVQRALSLEPSRRYVDMRAFEDDLERLLGGRPVAARPDGLGYRLHCWARRQPALAGASVVLAATAVAAPITIIAVQRASAARLRSAYDDERDARLAAEDLSEFVVDVLESADPNRNEPGAAERQILERGVERLEARLANRPLRRAELQRVLGRIHCTLGLWDEGVALLEESTRTFEAEFERMVALDGTTDDALVIGDQLVDSRVDLAEAYEDQNALDRALDQRERLVDLLLEFHSGANWQVLHARANVMALLRRIPDGQLEGRERPTNEEFEDTLRATLSALEVTGQAFAHHFAHVRGWLGTLLLKEAQAEVGTRRRELLVEALARLEGSLQAFEEMGSEDALDAADVQLAYGLTLKYLGRLVEADAAYTKAVAVFEERLAPDHFRIGGALINRAGLLEQLERFEDAVDALERAESILAHALSPEHPYTVTAAGNLAATRFRGGLHDGLAEEYDDVIRRQAATFGPEHAYLGTSHDHRGQLLLAAGRREEAAQDLQRARAIFEAHYGTTNASARRIAQQLAELELLPVE